MKDKLQTQFSTRQYMLSKDFEIYYYNDTSLTGVDSHTHNYYEFYFFIEGDVSVEIGDKIYPLSLGDIVLIPPHISHRPIIHSNKSPYRRFVFWISQDYCNHLMRLSPNYGYLMQYVLTNKDYLFHTNRHSFYSIQSKALKLIEELQSDHFGKLEQVTIYVNDLVLNLNRLIYEQKHSIKAREERSLYQNLCAFIEEHISEDLSLARLSKEFYISKYHISHVFTENLGISLHQYITKKRLELCREAIIGNMSITQAYQAFGFVDYSSFFRAFKKEYGISPKECQNMRFTVSAASASIYPE